MPEKKQKHAQTIPHSMMFANVWWAPVSTKTLNEEEFE